jgi:hypothetical protein
LFSLLWILRLHLNFQIKESAWSLNPKILDAEPAFPDAEWEQNHIQPVYVLRQDSCKKTHQLNHKFPDKLKCAVCLRKEYQSG